MALTHDQEKLKEAALAADKNGHHVCVNARDSNNWEANQAWHYAATPAAILAILAQLEQVQGWVSVKDRLPEYCEPVLAYGAKRLEWSVMIYTRANNWEMESSQEFHSCYAPTHWRELPPPPEAA